MAFHAKGVQSQVDYDKRRTELQTHNGPVRTELQLMQYAAYADKFSWDMNRHQLDLLNSVRGTSEGLDAMNIRQRRIKVGDMPGVRFVSTDKARK